MKMKVDGSPSHVTSIVSLSTVTVPSTVSTADAISLVRDTAYARPARSASTISDADADGALIIVQATAVRRGSVRSWVSSLASAHTARPADSAASQDSSKRNGPFTTSIR